MGLDTIAEGVDRFEAYLTGLTSVIGHEGRTAPLHDYCLDGRSGRGDHAAVNLMPLGTRQGTCLTQFGRRAPANGNVRSSSG